MKTTQWIGIDVDHEVSLYEDGLLVCKNWQCTEPDEWFCLVCVDRSNDLVVYGYIRQSELLNEDWINWETIYDYTGMTGEDWRSMDFVNQLSDLISYYGPENFGFNCYNAFTIHPSQLDSYMLNMKPQTV